MNEQTSRRENERTLNLDAILSTQPELGPSIPDGGCGWLVFLGILFFQALIPCLSVNFGIFLAFSKLEHGTAADKNVILWDEKLLYVLLFFSISRIFFDSLTRALASQTTTLRLIAVAGTCQTCAGLLFMWMGMTGANDDWLFLPAGILSGLGASLLMVQCEIILAQYFKLKLPVLNQISRFVISLSFLAAPVILGHYILYTSISRVLLWYQAIILQGLVVGLLFRKPQYLKSATPKPYQFITTNPEEEEDIFSKNSRELQIKRQTENHVTKIEINEPQPGPSNDDEEPKHQWETFEDDEEVKYDKLNEWETFEDEDIATPKNAWERFEGDGSASPHIVNELSLAEETRDPKNEEPRRVNNAPSPLFSDFPVNNNNTYAYDEGVVAEAANSNVFMPSSIENEGTTLKRHLEVLKQPSFYKTLLTSIANTYSVFVFYSLYPSFLYIQADSVNIRHMTGVMGALALVNLFYVLVSFWVKISKDKRALCYGIFYWVGCVGYFMISDFTNEYVLLIGAVQVILSIVVLEHTVKPLLGISLRGETSAEYSMLSMLSGLALFVFLFLDATFRTCFRLMAVLHFFTGTLWLSNFAYKKLRVY